MSNELMSDEQFAASVKSIIDDAVDYVDGFVAPTRALATQYYRGDPLGNEEAGRSQVVMTELRDVVQAIVPSLLRIFTSSEHAVEYAPRNEAEVAFAEQATDYVNFVFYNDNPGFQVLLEAFKDALIRKTGIIKWRWSEDAEISEASYTGLDQASYNLLLEDKDVEVVEEEARPDPQGIPQIDPATGLPGAAPQIYDIRIRRSKPRNKIVVEAIPPEEFLIARNARDLDTAEYVGHRSLKTVSELIAMGYSQKEIEENSGGGDVFSINYEAQTRNPALMTFTQHMDSADQSLRRIVYVESYIRIDRDGDGIAELRRVCTLGNSHSVLHDEVATDVPFAVLCPDPEPHMIIGQAVGDQVMDLQRIKTAVVRNTLDSLAQVIHPRTVVVEGQVNLDDVMNTETGAIIRTRAPGMIASLSEPFVGQNAMPIIAYLDQVRAQRTGISAASQGLDPDVLQSTTKAAVTATVQGAQERIELIARVFAETGIKRLFKGLLKMIVRHQDRPRTVKLRGQWIEIDPKYWDADMDVQVNVGLGRGSDNERLQFMMMVLQKQEQIMQLLGPANPICDVSQYSNSLSKLLELANIKDASRYFKRVDGQTAQVMQQAMAQQKPQTDPNAMLAQIEMAKVQAAQAKQADEAHLKRMQILIEDAFNRDKLRADTELRAAELNAKYNTQFDLATLENSFAHSRELAVEQLRADSAERQAAMNAQQMTEQTQPYNGTPA